MLRAEWAATEAVVQALDEEVQHPIMSAVASVMEALGRKSFEARLEEQLAASLETVRVSDGSDA